MRNSAAVGTRRVRSTPLAPGSRWCIFIALLFALVAGGAPLPASADDPVDLAGAYIVDRMSA